MVPSNTLALGGEHRVAVVAEDEEVSELNAVLAGELVPAAPEIHVTMSVQHHLHVQQATPSACLPQLHFAGLTAVEQLRELVRQPLRACSKDRTTETDQTSKCGIPN